MSPAATLAERLPPPSGNVPTGHTATRDGGSAACFLPLRGTQACVCLPDCMSPSDPPAAIIRPRALQPSPWTLLGTFVPLYALDQGTKWLVDRRLELGRDHATVVPGFFEIVHSHNRGAAFGMFQGAGVFFLALALLALVVLAVFWRRGAFAERWTAAGVCLLLPGILGNVTDRLTRGYVIDFLSFDLHFPGANPFATFNVADACICVAVGCFLIGSFLEERRRKPRPAAR